MNAIAEFGGFAWQALWLPVSVWTLAMGAVLIIQKVLPNKWVQVHLDLRLAGMLSLVVGVVASWIFPLTPESTVTFLAVNNPLGAVAPAVSTTPEVILPAVASTALMVVGVITLLALLVTILGLFQLIVGGYRLKKVLRHSGKANGMERVHSSVEVVFSSDTQVAFSAGILRRWIVLPTSIAKEDVVAVLAHELSHHTNGDIVRTWISHCVRALFFFHPLVHYLHAECQLLIEIACDRRILDSSALEPRAYADLLVRSTPYTNRSGPVLALAHSPSQLRKRISAMKNPILLPFKSAQLLTLGALFVFLIGGVVGCTEFQAGPTEPDVAMDAYDLVMELPAAGKTGPSEVFVIVEQQPTLIGGLTGLASQIKYPEIAKRAGVQGRVFLQFVVEVDGSVRDVIVTRGIGAGADEEAKRVVENAKFIPGVQDGLRVPVKMSLPITFKLGLDGEPDLNPAPVRPLSEMAPGATKIDPKTVVVYESLKDVKFEYDVVWSMDSEGKTITGEDLKGVAAQNGSAYLVKGGLQNIGAFPEGTHMATEGVKPSVWIAIRPKK